MEGIWGWGHHPLVGPSQEPALGLDPPWSLACVTWSCKEGLARDFALRMVSLGGQEKEGDDDTHRGSCLLAVTASDGAGLHSARGAATLFPQKGLGQTAWAAGVGRFQQGSGSGPLSGAQVGLPWALRNFLCSTQGCPTAPLPTSPSRLPQQQLWHPYTGLLQPGHGPLAGPVLGFQAIVWGKGRDSKEGMEWPLSQKFHRTPLRAPLFGTNADGW